MRAPLLLALLLPVSFAFAAEAPAKTDAPLTIQVAAPDLLIIEKDLAGKLEERDTGTLTLEEYRKWEADLRARLSAVIERSEPSPENQAAHARIMALLGERTGAAAALDRALDGNPDNTVLLRTKGRLLLEQKDYAGAAEYGRLAWEKSGKTDADALALYQTAKDRVAPTGAGAPAPTVGSTPSNGSTVASSDAPSKPYKLPIKRSAKPNEIPAFAADPASDASAPSKGAGLLTMLGIGAGVLLIAWGAMPAETKDRLKQDLWERPKQEMKVLAATTAAIGVLYVGWTALPAIVGSLGTGAPTGAALTPALAGGGTTGGGIAFQQATIGTAKAGLLAGGSWSAAKTWEQASFAKQKHTGEQSRPVAEEWHKGTFDTADDSIKYHLEKHGKGRTVEEYTRAAIDFFKANKDKAKKVILKDNSPGWQIKGKSGGYWTENGRVVTFWD